MFVAIVTALLVGTVKFYVILFFSCNVASSQSCIKKSFSLNMLISIKSTKKKFEFCPLFRFHNFKFDCEIHNHKKIFVALIAHLNERISREFFKLK